MEGENVMYLHRSSDRRAALLLALSLLLSLTACGRRARIGDMRPERAEGTMSASDSAGEDVSVPDGGGDSALTAALGRIPYYCGDPSRCTMTPEQAAAFAQVIRDNMAQLDAAAENYILDGNGELVFNGISWGTPADHPTLSTAALFDLGDGTPALIFSGAAVNRTEKDVYRWLNSGIRGIWLYQDGAAVQYAPDQSHQAVFDGYLLTSDVFGPPYEVYPIENGAVASHPSTWAGMDTIYSSGTSSEFEYHYYIDSIEVSRGDFDAWVAQWAHAQPDPEFSGWPRWNTPQSPVGFAGSTDISWTSWGMAPAEELLAVLDELAEG